MVESEHKLGDGKREEDKKERRHVEVIKESRSDKRE
jgi:hypothetical protein